MQEDPYAGVETVINAEGTRALRAVPMGLAAYEGAPSTIVRGQWIGRHVGIFDDEDAAVSWLETGDPRPKRVEVSE